MNIFKKLFKKRKPKINKCAYCDKIEMGRYYGGYFQDKMQERFYGSFACVDCQIKNNLYEEDECYE